MLKIIIALSLSLTAFTTYAEEPLNCRCEQDFESYLDGSISHVTIYARCPKYSDESELSCSSKITTKTFSASCTNTVTNVQNTNTSELEPATKPTYSYTFCQLN